MLNEKKTSDEDYNKLLEVARALFRELSSNAFKNSLVGIPLKKSTKEALIAFKPYHDGTCQ